MANLFGIGEGPSQHEIQDRNTLNNGANFGIGLGEGDLTAASKYYQDLLSGDPSKTAEAMAPETSAAQEHTQQAKNTMAEFAPRSGGTAAAGAGMDTRTALINLLGSLRSGAARGAGAIGSSAYGTGMNGAEGVYGEDKGMHDQSAKQLGDLAQTIAAMVSGVAAGAPGAPGGFMDTFSNATGAVS